MTNGTSTHWLVTYDGDCRDTFRPDIPSVARIYDYLLGGKDNYPVDREVGESMIAQLPNVRLAVQWNRAFPAPGGPLPDPRGRDQADH
jgi:hypothetical protein